MSRVWGVSRIPELAYVRRTEYDATCAGNCRKRTRMSRVCRGVRIWIQGAILMYVKSALEDAFRFQGTVYVAVRAVNVHTVARQWFYAFFFYCAEGSSESFASLHCRQRRNYVVLEFDECEDCLVKVFNLSFFLGEPSTSRWNSLGRLTHVLYRGDGRHISVEAV